MHWVALAVVCAALIFVSYHSPKIGFSLLGIVGILVTVLYLINTDQSHNAEFSAAPDSVSLSQTDIVSAYGDSWDYSGRITNSSDKSVTDVHIRITLHDCPAQSMQINDDCATIGERVDFVPINVPPRQARDFSDTVSFRNAKPKGAALWDFQLTGVRVSD